MLPRVLKNFNTFIEGESYAGRASSITPPKLTRKFEEYRGAGMNGAIDIDMGSEKMEMEVTLSEYSEAVIKQYGITDHAGLGVRFVGAAVQDDSTGTTDKIEIVVRGRWKELDFGEAKSGDKTDLKLGVAVSYFKYILNGQDIIEIDHANMIEIVNGVDRLADQREALGM